jgi:nitronate monooxygenase
METLNQPGTEVLPYPLQRALVRHVAIPAEAAGRADLLALWAGQSASLSAYADPAAFLRDLIEDVSNMSGPVMTWSARYRDASKSRK